MPHGLFLKSMFSCIYILRLYLSAILLCIFSSHLLVMGQKNLAFEFENHIVKGCGLRGASLVDCNRFSVRDEGGSVAMYHNFFQNRPTPPLRRTTFLWPYLVNLCGNIHLLEYTKGIQS